MVYLSVCVQDSHMKLIGPSDGDSEGLESVLDFLGVAGNGHEMRHSGLLLTVDQDDLQSIQATRHAVQSSHRGDFCNPSNFPPIPLHSFLFQLTQILLPLGVLLGHFHLAAGFLLQFVQVSSPRSYQLGVENRRECEAEICQVELFLRCYLFTLASFMGKKVKNRLAGSDRIANFPIHEQA